MDTIWFKTSSGDSRGVQPTAQHPGSWHNCWPVTTALLLMACLDVHLQQESIHQPRGEMHCTADPPSHTACSNQSPLNEVGMFEFKRIRSIFKM